MKNLIKKWFNHKEKEEKEKKPCLHDQCSECHGTGKKEKGETCVHWISCPCPKCTPYY